MDLTKGQMMFYGGIGAILLLLLLSVILFFVFSWSKKRLNQRIEGEFDS